MNDELNKKANWQEIAEHVAGVWLRNTENMLKRGTKNPAPLSKYTRHNLYGLAPENRRSYAPKTWVRIHKAAIEHAKRTLAYTELYPLTKTHFTKKPEAAATEEKLWFVMLPTGMGSSSADFGPFKDLRWARHAEQTLLKAGLKPWIASEQTAMDDDLHGVNELKMRFPNGVDNEPEGQPVDMKGGAK